MEFAAKHHKRLLITLCLSFSLWSIPAYANPQGGQVAEGSATIEHTGDKTTIHQTSQKAIINWDTFNIAPHEHTHFQQPSPSAIALNRVNASYGASQILGKLTATGQVWIINPAGIFFGSNAIIDVAGLVATTANITNQDFMSGNYTFKNVPGWNAVIINQGRIQVKESGIVALVAPAVINSGVIEARLGQVALAAGKEFTIDFYGDRLINFGANSKITESIYDQNGQVIKDAIRNSGKILADGGKVLITADAAHAVLDNVINMDGLIDANTIAEKNGEIIIHGGNEGIVNISGTLSAKGEEPGETGGSIKITGDKVGLFAGAELNATGASGGGEILVGGDFQGQGTFPHANAVYIAPEALLKANALFEGSGGRIIAWSDGYTRAHGAFEATGGMLGGHGGLIETSGHILNVAGIQINLTAPNGDTGTWLLDPYNITISTNANLNGSYDGGSPDNTWIPSGNNSNVQIGDAATAGTLVYILDHPITGANVIINTSGGGVQLGDITVEDPITWTSARSLTLIADRDIIIDPGANISGSGALNLNAGRNILIQGNISTGGGNISLTSNDAITLDNNSLINAGSGAITILANQDSATISSFTMNIGSSIITTNGNVNIQVNTTTGGTGAAILRNITTGGGDITVTTYPLGSTGSIGGNLTLEDSQILSSGGGNIALTSADAIILDNNSLINAGSGTVTILANQDSATISSFTMNTGSSIITTNGNVNIQVNTTTGGTGAAILRNITTGGGDITVTTYPLGSTGTIGGNLTLEDSQILSSGGGNIALTSADALTLDNNSAINAGSGTVTILANHDSASTLDFNMNTGSSITTTNATANAVNIQVNTAAGGGGHATLGQILTPGGLNINTYSIGDIIINANLGTAGIPLNSLTITNANNVTNNSIIYTGTFDQQAGSGTTYLGAIAPGGGTNVTGASSITTNNVTGYIYTESLSLLTNAANIFGLVNGSGGQAGADAIVLLNIIGPGTHFFDGIDLYKMPIINPASIIPMCICPNYLQNLIDSWLLDERFNTDATAINKPKMCTGLRALFRDCLKLLIKRRR